MLPPFIIQQIRQREQDDRPQPRIEISDDAERPSHDSTPTEERGVVVIPLWD